MKFENTEVFNFKGALRGMRNPKNSWGRGDSCFCSGEPDCEGNCSVHIGKNDMKLAIALIKGGSEHRKFLRQIFVSVDITAPLYWWKEFDTYKVGTVANSTSTMHKLATTPITRECFELDDYCDGLQIMDEFSVNFGVNTHIALCEDLRQMYLKTGDKRYWKELIRWLPESWLQTRTVTMNYENVFNMVHQRKTHKLNEWSGIDFDTPNFIAWAKSLPYANEFIFLTEKRSNEENLNY